MYATLGVVSRLLGYESTFMRICYLSLGFLPATKLGGSIRSASYLTKALTAAGHEVTVCCTNLAARNEKLFPETKRISRDGVDVIYFNTHNLFPLGRNSFGLFVCPELPAFCRRELRNYDIVHMDGYRDFPVLITSHYCRRYGIPYLIQARNSMPLAYGGISAKRAYDRLFGGRILGKCALFIASSAAEELDYRAIIPPGSRIRYIPNGLDVDDYARLPERGAFRRRYEVGERTLITYVGRLHAVKGIDHLIRGFAIAQCRRKSRLAIVGPDDGSKGMLLELARQLGLIDSVIFVDTLEGEEKLQAYVDSDLVVYAAQFESFGLVGLEATMCGIPVITARKTGCGQLMETLGADFTVDYGDTQQMADAMDYVLTHSEVVAPRVRAAREKLKSEFSWTHIARQYEDAYRSIVHQNSMPEKQVASSRVRASEKL